MKRYCVDKSNKAYKLLSIYWGDTMAEGIVKSYTEKYLQQEEYYYPKVSESIDYIKNKVKDRIKAASYYFNNEPNLTEEGARKVLVGIIHRFNDDFYVTKGYQEGLLIKEVAKREIERPNIEFLNKLSNSFPGLITLKPTQNGTKVIFDFESIKKVTPITTVNTQLSINFTEDYPNLEWMDSNSRKALINAIDKGQIESTCK